jgi:hypothetical protein
MGFGNQVYNSHSDPSDEIQRAADRVESAPNSLKSAASHELPGAETNSPIDNSGNNNGKHSYASPDDPEMRMRVGAKEEIKPAGRASVGQQRRFGVLPAVAVLAVGTAAVAGIVGMSSNDFFAAKEPAVAPETVADEPFEATAKTPQQFSKQTPATKSAPRLRGTFETTRPTQIYSRPSENSSLIASIGRGMKINVVDSRDGWLEIRSKHGRPPGFIRQEAAMKIDRN